ncbi:unnamed protein product [Owenia fusiformis]|uniref:Kinesin-like protein n=1 Tax=Owenia fusiformis TaxID=6347 RepID=A0A8J1UBT4_OWEFU|nr:unnamed protein product [Owenia fusiformis]
MSHNSPWAKQASGTPLRRKDMSPVFKTPMTFSPRLAGEQAKPSPSKFELWKEELGLDEDEEEEEASSGSEEESDKENDEGNCSIVEYQSLKKELEERNQQRDELLFRIKTLSDKNKQYRTRLQKEETNKKQQIKIMRKTHESHLQDKMLLISNLEDVIQEQEAKIMQLEAELIGDTSQESRRPISSTVKLIEQLKQHQQEKADFMGQLLNAQNELANFKDSPTASGDTLKSIVSRLEAENKELQEEVVRLGSMQNTGTTDTEKQLQKLEIETDQLQQELREARNIKPQVIREIQTDTAQIKRLETKIDDQQKEIFRLESELKSRCTELKQAETRHYGKLQGVSEEKSKIERELRQLRVELTTLQAKPPEVVTKIERVEVESKKDRISLEKSIQDNTKLQGELSELQQLYKNSQAKLVHEQGEVKKLNTKLDDYGKEMQLVQQEMEAEINRCQQEKQEAVLRAQRQADQKMETLNANFTKMKVKLSLMTPTMKDLMKDYTQLKKQCENMPNVIKTAVKQTTKEISKSISDISEHNQELVKKYKKEMALRKKYHNELVELKGNIRVFCRVRPQIKEDGSGPPATKAIGYDQDDDCVLYVANKGRTQTFEVDSLFTEKSTQVQVFNEVQPLVVSCLDGYNVCIFAYGQTGSGKTYTMEGVYGDAGINQRALTELFTIIEERGVEWQYTISVSVMEIYNEMLRDLLSSDPSYKMEIKRNQDGSLYVPGLTTVPVSCLDDVNETFALGKTNRATATTNMNEHSSRSHCLLCVTVTGVSKTTGKKSIGKLNLIDLAGSERISKSGAEGSRLKEAQSINKSLSSLGDVIHALRNKQGHIPYRNSKLTYLLQDSLGGDSKTLMIVQVAPVEKNVGETICSLNFGQRVRAVELGQASKKTESAEVTELKERLALYEDSPVSTLGKGSTPSKVARRK